MNQKYKRIELEKKMIGKYFPVSIGIHADAATATIQLYKEIKKQKMNFQLIIK